MNINKTTLSFNEKVIFSLRSLYNERGYSQYKMSKFEEYDLYAKNKDFLISDSVITFTDTNGKLLALKPDVTLSIIKNSVDEPNTIQKVYYNENVYRISKGTHTFKEIMQVGLECLGDIDNYNICEVITLACKSLKQICENYVLDISHLGIITNVFDSFNIPSESKKEILKLISEKNTHELTSLCSSLGLNSTQTEVINAFVTTYGKPSVVLPKLKSIFNGIVDIAPIEQLSCVINAIDKDIADMINIDFSVVSDTHYYNGIVFKGFIEGVPSSVLSGGQYDKLMQKMKRKSCAIGFAVYLDLLEILDNNAREYDVDVVLLYDDKADLRKLNKQVNALSNIGQNVYACKVAPSKLKYKTLINFNDCEVDTLEDDA
ncbi:MAG: hypothetical protein E7513_01210 [Ruminococcaceae bacterium]|nr:hypothetical protein [Oscillospiraceae bacterium]